MNLNRFKSPSGFTLLELVLYISLSTLFLSAISFFLFFMLESRIKNQVINEVNHQGLQTVQYLAQTLRNAKQVDSPLPGNSSQQLSIEGLEAAKNPTVLSLSESLLQVQEGMGDPILLSTAPVIASDLNFYNLSVGAAPDSIRFEFTLTYDNPDGRKEYDYQKTFQATASLRPNS